MPAGSRGANGWLLKPMASYPPNHLFDARPRFAAEDILLTTALHDPASWRRLCRGVAPAHFTDATKAWLIFGAVQSARIFGWPDIRAVRRAAIASGEHRPQVVDLLIEFAGRWRYMIIDDRLIAWAVRVVTAKARAAA